MTTQGAEEKFDSSLSNNVISVHRNEILDVMEEISDLVSDPLTLKDPILPVNSWLITCTNTQSLPEGGENCAYVTSMDHLGLLFHIIGASLTLFGSNL